MFNSDMDTLLEDTSIHILVDTDTNRGLGDIENNSSAAVVMLEGHTLVDGGVGEDIDVVTDLDGHEVLGESDGAVVAELLGEHVTRTRPFSE